MRPSTWWHEGGPIDVNWQGDGPGEGGRVVDGGEPAHDRHGTTGCPTGPRASAVTAGRPTGPRASAVTAGRRELPRAS